MFIKSTFLTLTTVIFALQSYNITQAASISSSSSSSHGNSGNSSTNVFRLNGVKYVSKVQVMSGACADVSRLSCKPTENIKFIKRLTLNARGQKSCYQVVLCRSE
jgi:hypothetical protein